MHTSTSPPPPLPARPTPGPPPNLLALRQPTLPLQWTKWVQSTKPISPTAPARSPSLANYPTRAPTPRSSGLPSEWNPSYLGQDTVDLVLRLARLGQPEPSLQPTQPIVTQPSAPGSGAEHPLWRESQFGRAGADARVAALRARRGQAQAGKPLQVRSLSATLDGRSNPPHFCSPRATGGTGRNGGDHQRGDGSAG